MLLPYRFGRAELRPVERELLIDGRPAAVGARALDLLLVLIERRERAVTKNELLDLVWPGLVVEENNLYVHISALRKLLGPQVIATIPGRGYRFALAVRTESTDSAKTPTSSADTSGGDAVGGSPQRAVVPSAFACDVSTPGSSLPERLFQLFGRADDLTQLQHLLSLHALITIVGPAGIGKTRLAAAVADARRHHPTRRVGWVDLAPLVGPTSIPGAMAGALGIPLDEAREPIDVLVAAMKKQSLLVVLDNCEHVVETVATIASALLAGTQDVQLLATSRTPLKIPDEQVYRLGPLAVPAAKASAREAAEHGAVALFVARAHAADRRFEFTDDTVAAVVDVCTRLDGMPLAIELAAARLPLLGLSAMAAMLGQRLRLLKSGSRTAPARQQTMHAAFDWSHELLNDVEKFVFRRLGIFAAGFALEAARAVVPSKPWDEWDVVDALGALVEKSLVAVEGDDPPRYRLLETARAYALEKLEAAGETRDLARRHAAYFGRFFDDAYDAWLATSDVEWRARTEPELENLRTALSWALRAGGDTAIGVALAAASLPVWRQRDSRFRREGRDNVRSAMELLGQTTDFRVEARLRFALALLAPEHAATDERRASLERAVALLRGVGDDRALCHCLVEFSRVLTQAGQFSAAERTLCEAEALLELEQAAVPRLHGLHRAVSGFHRQMTGNLRNAQVFFRGAHKFFEDGGAKDLALATLNDIADAAWALGDVEGAAAGFREAADRTRQLRFADEESVGTPLANLAGVLIEQGKLDQATPIAREALQLLREAECAWSVCDALALRLALLGKHEDAARLEGFVNRAYEAASLTREPNEERLRARLLALLRERFSEPELDRLLRAGAEFDENEAYQIAL